jgi:hypothetical protein
VPVCGCTSTALIPPAQTVVPSKIETIAPPKIENVPPPKEGIKPKPDTTPKKVSEGL